MIIKNIFKYFDYLILSSIIFLLLIDLLIFNSYFDLLFNQWSYNEILINYQGGFIRRGLLGEIILKLNYANIDHLIFMDLGIIYQLKK